MSTNPAEIVDTITDEIPQADISARLDAGVPATIGSIDVETAHSVTRYRQRDIEELDANPEVNAFCYEGQERATLTVDMGIDEDARASVELEAEGCREIAVQLLRAAAELEATDE